MEVVERRLRSLDPSVLTTLENNIRAFPLLGVSKDVARRCAGIRHDLRSQGKRVRPRALDLLIAATALEHGLTLVTSNTGDYSDIPGLRLY
jgi:predicted nucleic acid-binding protein